MADKEIGIKITADGRVFITEVGKAEKALKQLDDQASKTSGSGSKLDKTFGNMVGFAAASAGALAFVGSLTAVSRSLIDAQIQADRLQTTMKFAMGGDVAKSASGMVFVSGLARDMGLEFQTTAESFTQFSAATRGTVLEGSAAREIFESMAQASTALGLSSDKTGNIMLALTQMISKGKIGAEEWTQQLGEAMPIANDTMARALGKSTTEIANMLEKGQLTIGMLSQFAQQLKIDTADAANEAADKVQASTNRMANAWLDLKKAVSESGMGSVIKGQLDIATDAMEDFSASIRKAKAEGSGFWGQLGAGTAAALRFANPLNAVSYAPQAGKAGMQALLDRNKKLEAASMADYTGNSKQQLEDNKQLIAQHAIKFPETARMATSSPAGPTASETADQMASMRKASAQQKELAARDWEKYYQTVESKSEQHARALAVLDQKATAAGIGKDSKQYKAAVAELADKYKEKSASKKSDPVESNFLQQKLSLSKAIAAANTQIADTTAGVSSADGKHAAALAEWLKYDKEGAVLGKDRVATLQAMATAADKQAVLAKQTAEYYDYMRSSAVDIARARRDTASIQASGMANPYQARQKLADEFSPGGKLAGEKDPARRQGLQDQAAAKDRSAMQQSNAAYGYDTGQTLEQMQFSNDLLNRSVVEQEKLNLLHQAALDFKRRSVGLTGEELAEAERLRDVYQQGVVKSLADKEAKQGDAMGGAKKGFDDYMDNAKNVSKQTEELTGRAMGGLEDSLVNAAMTGKMAFGDMAKSILADLARIAIKKAIVMAVSSMFGDTTASAKGNAFAGGQVTAFAKGGAFTNSIATRPTLAPMALFGEAGPEAVMPLARDSSGSLGVKLVGPLARDTGGTTSQISVAGSSIQFDLHVTYNANGSQEEKQSGGDNAGVAKALGERMKAMALSVIQQEQRPGGLLYGS